jgi:hypothetical protein
LFVTIGSNVDAAAGQVRHKPSSLNPKICPAPSLIASAMDIPVLQYHSFVQIGQPNNNTCNYLTTAVLQDGHPSWVTAVSYQWPISTESFAALRGAYVSTPADPIVNISHLGTAAIGTNWVVIVLSGRVEMRLGCNSATPAPADNR